MGRMERYERCGGWSGMIDVEDGMKGTGNERCGGWTGMKAVVGEQV